MTRHENYCVILLLEGTTKKSDKNNKEKKSLHLLQEIRGIRINSLSRKKYKWKSNCNFQNYEIYNSGRQLANIIWSVYRYKIILYMYSAKIHKYAHIFTYTFDLKI